jgi:hypothetical protein
MSSTPMKQYMLSVHHAEGDPMPDDATIQQMFADVEAFNTELRASGAWVFAGGLQPPASATVVRVKEGEALLTDGPFSESKEQLGGFWVVKAPDLDAALELARRGATACQGPVEVRPFQDDAED